MSLPDKSPVNAAELFSAATRAAADILASSTGVDALENLADTACRLVGARYAAIGVANADGTGLDEFVVSGMSDEAKLLLPDNPSPSPALAQAADLQNVGCLHAPTYLPI